MLFAGQVQHNRNGAKYIPSMPRTSFIGTTSWLHTKHIRYQEERNPQQQIIETKLDDVENVKRHLQEQQEGLSTYNMLQSDLNVASPELDLILLARNPDVAETIPIMTSNDIKIRNSKSGERSIIITFDPYDVKGLNDTSIHHMSTLYTLLKRRERSVSLTGNTNRPSTNNSSRTITNTNTEALPETSITTAENTFTANNDQTTTTLQPMSITANQENTTTRPSKEHTSPSNEKYDVPAYSISTNIIATSHKVSIFVNLSWKLLFFNPRPAPFFLFFPLPLLLLLKSYQ